MNGPQQYHQPQQPQQYQQPQQQPEYGFDDLDPELAKYLNRNYWQQRAASSGSGGGGSAPSAPPSVSTESTQKNGESVGQPRPKVADTSGTQTPDPDREQFLAALRGSLQIFNNRMRSNQMRGRSIANDSAVQTLFMTINAMHPRLLQYIGADEELRSHHEVLQDKLAQVRDAREALDALRAENEAQRRAERAEAERQRHMQMLAKLETLRMKKHEYLEQQRQQALARMAEQEAQFEARLEHQKQQAQMRSLAQYGPAGAVVMSMPTAGPGFNQPYAPPPQQHPPGAHPDYGYMPHPGEPTYQPLPQGYMPQLQAGPAPQSYAFPGAIPPGASNRPDGTYDMHPPPPLQQQACQPPPPQAMYGQAMPPPPQQSYPHGGYQVDSTQPPQQSYQQQPPPQQQQPPPQPAQQPEPEQPQLISFD